MEVSMRTMAVQLLAGQSRSVAANRGTLELLPVRLPPAGGFRQRFCDHYHSFVAAARGSEEPGLAVVAIDEATGELAGLLRLAARPGRVVPGIVGRHGRADLFLEGCAALSLRALAILLEPARTFRKGFTDASYRLVDLRTGHGFADEKGRDLVAVRAEGSAFFHCGGHSLLVLAVGDPSDWPERADEAWSLIPDRVFFDERRAPGPEPARRAPPGHEVRVTGVTAVLGPRELEDPASPPGGIAAGTLEIRCAGRRTRVPVTEERLREGILVGRYDRCDASALVVDLSVSRTHLLVLAVGGAAWAIDTGSTNGMFHEGRRVSAVPLADGTRLSIGGSTEVVWRTGEAQERCRSVEVG
jgi:hypothetical protein